MIGLEIPVSQLPVKEFLIGIGALASGSAKKHFRIMSNKNKVKKVYDHLRDLGKVRTIWQTDRPVNINNFYYRQELEFDGYQKFARKISDITNLSNRMVVEGIVGQGKSILLRYLASQEIKLKKIEKIPVFLEFRKFKSGKNLHEYILDYIEDIGFNHKDESLDFLLKNNKITLLLDAFDELNQEIENEILSDIERFCVKHPEINIIITSRPNTSIQNSSYFSICRITPLYINDIHPILKKLTAEQDSADTIFNSILNSESNIIELLTTPLMATLLVFVYRAEQRIPSKPIEFYDSLFETVFSRHDNSKPGGVNRNRKTNLSNSEFQDIFNLISFKFSQESETSISEREILKYIDSAKSYYNYKFIESDYLNELCKITCLVLKDGFNYSYLHKSIQEYHASCFVSKLPTNRKIEFYHHILKKDNWKIWAEHIEHLIELDEYEISKNFLLPSIKLLQTEFLTRSNNIKKEKLKELIDNSYISVFSLESRPRKRSFSLKIKIQPNEDKPVLSEFYSGNIILTRFRFSIFDLLENIEKVQPDKFRKFYIENVGSGFVKLDTFLETFNSKTIFIDNLNENIRKKVSEDDKVLNDTINRINNTESVFNF